MSTDQPYDYLGRILEEGGERAIALAVARGWSGDKINNLIKRKFPGLSDDDATKLTDFGRSMVDSAANVELGGESTYLGNIEMPINPFMQQSESDGGRFRWIGEVQFEGATTGILVYGTSPDYPNSDDLYDMIVDAGMGIAEQYPGKFGLESTEDLFPQTVRIVAISGGF